MQKRRLSQRATYAAVGLAVVAAVLLRLPFLHNGTYPDEGGMLVVAREWHTGGPYLYGDYFLARPPLIMLLFRLAGDILAVRLLGLVLVAVTVAAAAWSGAFLAGRRGAITAAVVTGAFLANPMLGSREIDAETVGVPFAMTAVACVLTANGRPRGSRGRAWLLVASGVFAVGALLAKQNLADSLAFAVVLVVASAVTESPGRRAGLADVGWLALGIAVPVLGTLVWAGTASSGLHELAYELYGFRAAGGQAVFSQPTSAQNDRLQNLVEMCLRSGLVPVVLASLWLLRRRWWSNPVTLALLAMLATALVGVAGGGQYWIHYALGLVPVTAVLAARGIGQVDRPRLLGAFVASAVVITGWHVTDAWRDRHPVDESWAGGTTEWLNATKRPGDSMVVLYGQASLYETTRIRPAYPYLWSLPMRVRDPKLADLRALLAGPDAPTFVLAPLSLNSWGIDPDGRLQDTLARHYRWFTDVCLTPVYVHVGVHRQAPPAPTSCV